jgi:hypothetical protein
MKTPIFILFIVLTFSIFAQNKQIVWSADNRESVDMSKIEIFGNPTVISTPYGNAVEFHAANSERIQINQNPVADAEEFTIEVIFKPYSMPDEAQPRFFHICTPADPNNKNTLTFETRYNSAGWYADYFIRSVANGGQINPELTHSIGEWYHIAMVYNHNSFTGYLNGVQEASAKGNTGFTLPDKDAAVSLGGRMNNCCYFDGLILKVIFTRKALKVSEFSMLNKF